MIEQQSSGGGEQRRIGGLGLSAAAAMHSRNLMGGMSETATTSSDSGDTTTSGFQPIELSELLQYINGACTIYIKEFKNKPTSLTVKYVSAGKNSLFQGSNKASCREGIYPSSTNVQ
jgi:hypothetical protein